MYDDCKECSKPQLYSHTIRITYKLCYFIAAKRLHVLGNPGMLTVTYIPGYLLSKDYYLALHNTLCRVTTTRLTSEGNF